MAFEDIHSSEFMTQIPEQWDDVEYGEFLGEVKGASILQAWIDEKSEDDIIERFSFEPGKASGVIEVRV